MTTPARPANLSGLSADELASLQTTIHPLQPTAETDRQIPPVVNEAGVQASTASASETEIVPTGTLQNNSADSGSSGGANNLEPQLVQESVLKIKKELEEWKRNTDISIVDTAISTLQLLIAKPAAVFDAYAAIGALEGVVDVARNKADDRAGRFSIILRQCRPLIGSPSLQQILVKLVASKEEVEVAKVIGKALKDQSGPARSNFYVGRTRGAPYHAQDRRPRPVSKCWSCGLPGHFARACPNRRH